MDEQVTIINKLNKEVTISRDGNDFILTSIEGLGVVDSNIYTSKSPNQDGVSYKESTLDIRPITIELVIIAEGKTSMAIHRRQLQEALNSTAGQFTIIYKNGSTERTIKGVLESMVIPFEPNFPDKKQTVLLEVSCSNPFLKENIKRNSEIASWIGGMKFPVKFPTRFAMAGSQIINVYNSGDVETPIKVEIYGPATNPRISLRETGQFILINDTLTADDVYTITTGFGNKRVEKNGENAFNKLDLPDSKLFSLNVGDNVVSFTTDDPKNDAKAKITYTNRYLGV